MNGLQLAFRGKKVEDLSREEMLACIKTAYAKIKELQDKERDGTRNLFSTLNRN